MEWNGMEQLPESKCSQPFLELHKWKIYQCFLKIFPP